MQGWKTTVRVSRHVVKIVAIDETGYEIFRARLPRRSDHPRALLTVLEGLALWSGVPLIAAISVDASAGACASDLFGGTSGSAESALVRIDLVLPHGRLRLRSFRESRSDLGHLLRR